jgi:signal transduction histidine kinase
MNHHLQKIRDLIQQNHHLSDDLKNDLFKSLKDAGKELEIVSFKLERTEKVKRTTAILLEETIEELEQKRKAIEESNEALQKSLDELKAAQKQLIHAEKMASLGELTAGIAHEIQNPLNFVNNFSDVSAELADELKEELAVGNWQLAKEIADDIIQNLEKIHHHGKRADGIVKGMLQHSRTTSNEKESTDINVLADEYLRLAYHGLRAKDKSFNAEFKTAFDPSLPTIQVIPQDIGRVLLNLINNAFYAVAKKASETNNPEYKPEVSIHTRKRSDGIEIRVQDNGGGIPGEIRDKIFQPFFTTKATGEGTGLGLSLSYDIITKGHGGRLEVESKTADGASGEETGTEFIIVLNDA